MSRIIDYTEATSPVSDDYLIIDGSTEGTRKIKPANVGATLDLTLTDPDKAAPAKMVGDRVRSISENTKNIFNIDWLYADNITVNNSTAHGKAVDFHTAFGSSTNGIPLNVEENTQYVLSGKAKTDGSSGTTGNGIVIRIWYTDETFTSIGLSNGWTNDYHDFKVVSDAGKTITRMSISYGSSGDNTWDISYIQIEKGVQKTDFIPYYTAIDVLARNRLTVLESAIIDPLYHLVWEHGTLLNGADSSATATNMRNRGILHVRKGSRIRKTLNTIAITASWYSANDVSAYTGATQILPLNKMDDYVFLEDVYVRFVIQNPNALPHDAEWAKTVLDYELIDADYYNKEVGVKIAVCGSPSYLGNCIIVQLPDSKVFVIDCFTLAGYTMVKNICGAMGVKRFDYFMISHYHQDHVGNVLRLINDGYIDSDTVVYLPPDLDTSYETNIFTDWLDENGPKAMYQQVRPAIEELGCTVIHPTEGQVVSYSGIDFKFFNCDHSVYYPGGTYKSTNYNDLSLACYIIVDNYNFCDTADIGPIAQQKMVDLNTMFKANLYTATHHGWDNGSESNYYGLLPAWINRLSPDVVFSEDYSSHNTHIMTKKAPMQSWCEATGVPNYRTAVNGSMFIAMNKYGWRLLGKYSRFIRNDKNWSYSDNSEHVETDS